MDITDLKRAVHSTIDFNAYNREFTVPLPNADWGQLRDIRLQFYCRPTSQPLVAVYGFVGIGDLRIYLGSEEVTDGIGAAVGRQLDSRDAGVVESQYRSAVSAYLEHLRGAGARDDEARRDADALEGYLASGSWQERFSRLGDRAIGWSGNLHPVNFIYRDMSLHPISLQDVWSETRGGDLRQADPHTITFSHGPLGGDLDHPAGRVVFTLEMVFKNPLEPILRRIQRGLDEARKTLEFQRTGYLEPIKEEVEESHEDIKAGLDAVAARVGAVEQAVGEL